uniref:NADH-ubiquinone oxidoreductase chain 4L n=1 Tax=Falcidens acutargatus TaxID=2079778 RepID=A0A343X865_9MOLL|nr:NADH dehydrogenase subunit 4L [Falcidens acutargatus]AWH02124.1 NADH dehydrogenase subunit 4L [Falcidens acutargatus]
MMEKLSLLGIFMVFISLFTLSKQTTHLLNCLLSLEMMLLGLILLTVVILSMTMLNIMMPLFLLTLGACEASLGLCLLVTIMRYLGTDLTASSLYKC